MRSVTETPDESRSVGAKIVVRESCSSWEANSHLSLLDGCVATIEVTGRMKWMQTTTKRAKLGGRH